jgi:hypothetical protein
LDNWINVNQNAQVKNLLGGLAGALAGGAVGYVAFIWIARQGFYALMLPGAMAGLGASLLVSNRSVLRGVLCGLFAVGLGLFAEWRFAPFIKDQGFGYFLAHIADLRPITLLLIIAGGGFGYWFALGRERGTRPSGPANLEP